MINSTKHLLFPYTKLPWHKDPDFKEMTYGDSHARGRRFKNNISPGSYIFFHTTKAGIRYITGYLKIQEILTREEAKKRGIESDSTNDDYVFIGDKNESNADFFLKFDKRLAQRFKSIKFNFDRANHSENECINYQTRPAPYISQEDVEMLLSEIESNSIQDTSIDDEIISFDEIHKLQKELKIRDYFAKNPGLIEKNAQYYDKETNHVDLVLKDQSGKLLVLEFKRPGIASTATVEQILNYANHLKNKKPGFNFRFGIVIEVSQVTPDLIEYAKSRNVDVFYYGFGLLCRKK